MRAHVRDLHVAGKRGCPAQASVRVHNVPDALTDLFAQVEDVHTADRAACGEKLLERAVKTRTDVLEVGARRLVDRKLVQVVPAVGQGVDASVGKDVKGDGKAPNLGIQGANGFFAYTDLVQHLPGAHVADERTVAADGVAHAWVRDELSQQARDVAPRAGHKLHALLGGKVQDGRVLGRDSLLRINKGTVHVNKDQLEHALLP